MRLRASFLVTAACLLALSAPAWARRLSSNFDISHATRIVSVQLKPGHYHVVADESTGQVKVLRNDRLVAQVKGKWVTLERKPEYSEMLTDNHDIQEFLFAGKKKAIKFKS
jgi:hypothetical protein